MSSAAGKPELEAGDAVVEIQLTGSHGACPALLEALHAQGCQVESASQAYPIGSSSTLIRMSADVVTSAGGASDA